MLVDVNEPHWLLEQYVDAGFSEVLDRVPPALRHQGLIVLGEIDLAGTLARRTAARRAPYRVFALCQTDSAARALDHDPRAGLLVLCHLAVAVDVHGRTHMLATDPLATLGGLTRDSQLYEIAMQLRDRLAHAMDEIVRALAAKTG
jgi:uncharacterized protein (DUF302 family)